ncbi:hypothetical protein VTO73DRAFT_13054 [Trametes versicolor]
MAAASNQWAAVGDAVNSLSLVETGVTIVRFSLGMLTGWGTVEFAKRLGPGGYSRRLTELETIINSWDTVLYNLTPAIAGRIEAEHGEGSVALMHVRLKAIKMMFGRLKVRDTNTSFWEKCSLWKTPLSKDYDHVQNVVASADAFFKASTERAMWDLIQSMVGEARQAQHQSMQDATSMATFTSPPSAHAGLGAPSTLPAPVTSRAYHTGTSAGQIPTDVGANTFDQLVQFTVAFLSPFARRRGNLTQRGNQGPPRAYTRV